MKDVTIERARTAKMLAAASWKQSDIAAHLKCTDRTVRRLISYELPGDEDAANLDCPSRVQFVERGWPLLLKLLGELEKSVDNEELKPKDLAVVLGILSDKLQRLSPPAPKTTIHEAEKIRFVFNVPGEDESGDTVEDAVEDKQVDNNIE